MHNRIFVRVLKYFFNKEILYFNTEFVRNKSNKHISTFYIFRRTNVITQYQSETLPTPGYIYSRVTNACYLTCISPVTTLSGYLELIEKHVWFQMHLLLRWRKIKSPNNYVPHIYKLAQWQTPYKIQYIIHQSEVKIHFCDYSVYLIP